MTGTAVSAVFPPDRHSLSRPSFSQFWVLQLAGWGAFVGATTLPWIGTYPLGAMLVNKLLVAGSGCVATLGLRSLYRRFLADDSAPWAMIALTVVASWAAALAWTGAASRLVQWAGPGARSPSAVPISGALFDGTLYHSLVLVTWSVLYLGIRHHRSLQAERERSLRAEALAHRAQLQALRYQLDPHFLFNTLNAISTFVVEQRTAEADRMISRLSDFLRLTLDGRDAVEIPLAEELEFVRRYLEIEKVRFGDRLVVGFDVAPDAFAVPVPSMVLQPIVENSIRHAIARCEAGGRIAIAATRHGDRLRVAVTDDGPGLAGIPFIEGIGLRNTRERLARLYGGAGHFELVTPAGGGTSAVFDLPVRAA